MLPPLFLPFSYITLIIYHSSRHPFTNYHTFALPASRSQTHTLSLNQSESHDLPLSTNTLDHLALKPSLPTEYVLEPLHTIQHVISSIKSIMARAHWEEDEELRKTDWVWFKDLHYELPEMYHICDDLSWFQDDIRRFEPLNDSNNKSKD